MENPEVKDVKKSDAKGKDTKKTVLDEVFEGYSEDAKSSKTDVKEVDLLSKHSVTFTDDYGPYEKGFVLSDISTVAKDFYEKTGKAKATK